MLKCYTHGLAHIWLLVPVKVEDTSNIFAWVAIFNSKPHSVKILLTSVESSLKLSLTSISTLLQFGWESALVAPRSIKIIFIDIFCQQPQVEHWRLKCIDITELCSGIIDRIKTHIGANIKESSIPTIGIYPIKSFWFFTWERIRAKLAYWIGCKKCELIWLMFCFVENLFFSSLNLSIAFVSPQSRKCWTYHSKHWWVCPACHIQKAEREK